MKRILQIITTLILLYSVPVSNAQVLHFEYQVDLKFDLQNVSADSEGLLYLASANGSLFKYNEKGDSIMSFSPGKKAEISLIEASRGLKIFLFYHEFQEYVLLDRFLRPSPYYPFNQDQVGFVSLATIGNDENLWLLDPVDFSLKKYNIKSNLVEINSPLNQIIPIRDYDISFIKEYQNMLYIIDTNTGIYVFDNMGNYQKPVQASGIKNPGFSGNELYFMKGDKISFIQMNTGFRKDIQFPAEPAFSTGIVRVSKNRIYLFEKRRILIYKII